jgi:hypothetical protein
MRCDSVIPSSDRLNRRSPKNTSWASTSERGEPCAFRSNGLTPSAALERAGCTRAYRIRPTEAAQSGILRRCQYCAKLLVRFHNCNYKVFFRQSCVEGGPLRKIERQAVPGECRSARQDWIRVETGSCSRNQLRSRRARGASLRCCRAPHPSVRPWILVVSANGKGRARRAAKAQVFANLGCTDQESHRWYSAPGHEEALGHGYRVFHCGKKAPVSHRHGRPSRPSTQGSWPSLAKKGRSPRMRLARRCHPS